MEHLETSQLLEEHFLPGSRAATTRHLDQCAECPQRLRSIGTELEREARAFRENVEDQPETFWARQRLSIQRAIRRPSPRRRPLHRLARVAAAAALVLLLATPFILVRLDPSRSSDLDHAVNPTASRGDEGSAATVSEAMFEPRHLSDPWQLEEIEPFQQVVQWEAWVENEPVSGGGTS